MDSVGCHFAMKLFRIVMAVTTLQLERPCSRSVPKQKKVDKHATDSKTDVQMDREMRACAADGVNELPSLELARNARCPHL